MNEIRLFYILSGLFLLLLILLVILKIIDKLQGPELENQDLVPDGEIPPITLRSEKYGLVGKPDLLLKKDGEYFPIEIKSALIKDRPYPSNILQLAAYCLLIKENYGVCPSHGIIRYKNQAFEIPFTRELQRSLLTQLKAMRASDPEENDLPPVCEDPVKCRHCGYAYLCHTGQKRLF